MGEWTFVSDIPPDHPHKTTAEYSLRAALTRASGHWTAEIRADGVERWIVTLRREGDASSRRGIATPPQQAPKSFEAFLTQLLDGDSSTP